MELQKLLKLLSMFKAQLLNTQVITVQLSLSLWWLEGLSTDLLNRMLCCLHSNEYENIIIQYFTVTKKTQQHKTYLDCSKIHGLLDNVMVIMQSQEIRIHWLIEGPRITLNKCTLINNMFWNIHHSKVPTYGHSTTNISEHKIANCFLQHNTSYININISQLIIIILYSSKNGLP